MANQRISEDTRARITQVWPDLCSRLAAGELVGDVLKSLGISDTMKRAYLANEPDARREWDEAREASADAFMDEAMQVARGVPIPNSSGEPIDTRARDPQADRLHVDTLKWAARIRNPRLYGDKAQLDVNVRTVDLTRIITEAQARVAAYEHGRVIAGESARVLEVLPALGDLL